MTCKLVIICIAYNSYQCLDVLQVLLGNGSVGKSSLIGASSPIAMIFVHCITVRV